MQTPPLLNILLKIGIGNIPKYQLTYFIIEPYFLLL